MLFEPARRVLFHSAAETNGGSTRNAALIFWILFNQVKSIEGKPLQKARQYNLNQH